MNEKDSIFSADAAEFPKKIVPEFLNSLENRVSFVISLHYAGCVIGFRMLALTNSAINE